MLIKKFLVVNPVDSFFFPWRIVIQILIMINCQTTSQSYNILVLSFPRHDTAKLYLEVGLVYTLCY